MELRQAGQHLSRLVKQLISGGSSSKQFACLFLSESLQNEGIAEGGEV